MPELPEVETVIRTLRPVVTNKEITKCEILYERILPKNETEQFISAIKGRTITEIVRRGKYLIFNLDSPLRLIFHLRMTGQMIFTPQSDTPLAKHTSARFHFHDQTELRFVDQRKFGTIYLLPEAEYDQIAGLYTLGVEPLSAEFTLGYLAEKLQSKRAIKGLLLDQKLIAGLGNIYVDESLYRAGLHPTKPGNQVTKQQMQLLRTSIISVLQEAIANHGTTIKDYRTGSGDTGNFQNKLRVYGKAGQNCEICQTAIERIKVAGRSSHYCPTCQEVGE